MTTRLRERLASVGVGRMTFVSATVAAGVTAIVDIPVPLGSDVAVATWVAFGGNTQVGPLVFDLTNGFQDYSGYANTTGDPVDVFVPFRGLARLTVVNGTLGIISYNVALIALSDDEYKAHVQGRLSV